jgi:hypothetical protein
VVHGDHKVDDAKGMAWSIVSANENGTQQPCSSIRFALMRFLVLALAVCSSAFAGELIHEDFTAPELPKGWSTGGRSNSWRVADGVLEGECAKDDAHGPAVFAPLSGHDLFLSYKVKLDEGGNCLMLVDGESAFGGSAHLLRISLYGKNVTLAQDRGTPKSHVEQGAALAAARKEGKTLPPPTKEQLADPQFYRTERLATAPLQAKPGDWIKIDVVLKGNDVTVTLNDTQKLDAKGTVLDVAKSRLVFLVGQGKKVWIDEIRASTP